MMNLKMNKKANIPITILIVATIAVCIIALIAFHFKIKEGEEKVGTFKYLRVIYYFQNDLDYHGQDINFIKKELYPSSTLGFGRRSYYPVVKDIEQDNNNLVIRNIGVKRKWYAPWVKKEKIKFELKVPKVPIK